ncbi:MAG: CpaE family protein [Actinomycetota bacterium]|nr:AAA family ATPase [Actinomycetota bacterium]
MIVLADTDPRFHSRVSEQLGRPNDVTGVAGVVELEHLLTERTGQIDVVLLGPSVPSQEALRLAAGVQKRAPEVSVVLVADALSSELLQMALRSGVRDILSTEFTKEQLTGAVARAEELARQIRERSSHGSGENERSSSSQSEVITVFSSKGGVGKSFVSSNLGVMLAQRTGEPVVLVDLDLQFGDLAIMLQMFPARTMYDAAQNINNLDVESVSGYLAAHKSGVRLMAAPFEPGLADTISAESVGRVIKLLRHSFRYIVVDTPAAFSEHVVAALDDTDVCVLITSMDVPSIKNVKLALQTIDLLGFSRERIRLTLNRADAEVGLKVNEVEKTLGARVDVSIPSGREVPLSINRGVPLVSEAPNSPVVFALGKLADALGAANAPSASHQERRRFGRRRTA